MAVGVGIIGREVTFTVGGGTLVGVTTQGISFNNEALDTTDDQGSGWQERLAKPGRKSLAFSVEGLLKNLEVIETYFQTSNIVAVAVTYPDGSTLSFDAFLDNIDTNGAENELYTFSASFSSSGAPTFTPAA